MSPLPAILSGGVLGTNKRAEHSSACSALALAAGNLQSADHLFAENQTVWGKKWIAECTSAAINSLQGDTQVKANRRRPLAKQCLEACAVIWPC